MLDHVLIPLDLSALAEKALSYAPHIVSPDGQITLLTVIETTDSLAFADDFAFGGVGHPSMLEATQREQRARAEEYLNQVANRLLGSYRQVRKLVELGHPPDVIVDTAHRLGVKAIVMATHGRRGLSLWFFGSVTQTVLSKAPCPVWVIPRQVEPYRYLHVPSEA